MILRGSLRAATIALFATAAAVTAPRSAFAQDLTCERGDVEVRDLDFRGNSAIGDDELAVRVGTTPSSFARRTLRLWFAERRCLNRAELRADLVRIKQHYRDRGYYGAQVDTVVQTLGPEAVRVIFQIEEGEPVLVRSYSITGLAGVRDSAEIIDRMRLRVGNPFDVTLYRADADTIVSRLRNSGHYKVEVLPGWDTDTVVRRADVFTTIIPGPIARFGEPVFEVIPVDERGQQLATPVIRRVLGIVPGSTYSDRAVLEAQRNLFQLGAYRHVEITPLADSLQPNDTTVVLVVRLTEDYMKQLDSEFGWATLDCGRVRLQYSDRNFLGTARRIELTGQATKIGYGEPLQTRGTRDICDWLGQSGDLSEDQFSNQLHYFLGATIWQPRLLGTRWVPSLSLYSERRGEFKAYLRSTQVGGDISASRDIADRTPFRLGYTIEYGKTDAPDAAFCALFNRCDPDSRAALKELATLGVASAAIARFRVDNVVDPGRGNILRGELRSSASRLLGTSTNLFFSKGTGDIAWYHPLGFRNALAVRVRTGAVFGRRLTFGDTSYIPAQERLYAGGPTSVRGYQQNELGSVVYIARNGAVDTTVVGFTGQDTIYNFRVSANPDSIQPPDRSVPLGGNALIVTNIEYRLRDPFFFPNLLQYTLFLDGGDVWTRSERRLSWKWTPGFGIRALTPVGPVQVNVGYNAYARDAGPIFYNPNVNTLACATPGNSLTYTRGPGTGGLLLPTTDERCPDSFQPPLRTSFWQKLTFTFSIGPDF